MHTQDYEYLLDDESVLAVVVDDDDEELEIRVTAGTTEEEILSDTFTCEYDVVLIEEDVDNDVGAYDIEIADSTKTGVYRQEKIRSVMEGLSEGHKNITAGTAGPYVAKIKDKSLGQWSDDASVGQLVRLSNNHVYANVNEASFGDEILQPGPIDGGEVQNDTIGKLVGYLKLEDGCKADVAARTVDTLKDNPRPHGLPRTYGNSIHRGNPSELKGEEVCNTGRTLGVRWANVKRTGVTVNVRYGDGSGRIKVRNQVLTNGMSKGGQSGSSVYREKTGELCGILFAGSSNTTIFSHINQIENNFGVELVPYGDSYSGSLGYGFSNGKALPADNKIKINASVTNNSGGSVRRLKTELKVPDGWEMINASSGKVFQFDGNTYIHFKDVSHNQTVSSKLTLKADDSVNPSDKSTLTFSVNSGNSVDTDQSLDITMAENVLDYYRSAGNGEITGTEKSKAISHWREGRLSVSQVIKIINA